MTVAAVLLAAGEGSRFAGDQHKLLADLDGRPVLRWALDAAIGAGFDAVYLVWGAVRPDPALKGVDMLTSGLRLVESTHWADGQAHSLRAGIDAVRADGHTAAVVGLGDQPRVGSPAWRSVGAAAGTIVVATFDGERRPPVKLDRSVWHLLPEDGDEGARSLLRRRPELVLEVPCHGEPADVDTNEDLTRLLE